MGSGAMITSALLDGSAEIVAPPALNALLPCDAGANGVAAAALGADADIANNDPGVAPLPDVPFDCGESPLDDIVLLLSWPVSIARSVCATFTASAFLR